MIATFTYAIFKRKIQTAMQAVIIASAVFINIGVWFLEQLVKIDFEILSVSYIITELFLLTLHLMIQENEWMLSNNKADITKNPCIVDCNTEETLNDIVVTQISETEDLVEDTKEAECVPVTPEQDEKSIYFEQQLDTLTATERSIYKMHVDKMTTKDILLAMNIKENTLKYHNKNLQSILSCD